MSKITPLMTALHVGHKAEERIKCIDNMLFKKCEDTKGTTLQAFWWYRKHSIPLYKVKQAREEIANKYDDLANAWCEREEGKNEAILDVLEIIDKLIEEVEDDN